MKRRVCSPTLWNTLKNPHPIKFVRKSSKPTESILSFNQFHNFQMEPISFSNADVFISLSRLLPFSIVNTNFENVKINLMKDCLKQILKLKRSTRKVNYYVWFCRIFEFAKEVSAIETEFELMNFEQPRKDRTKFSRAILRLEKLHSPS